MLGREIGETVVVRRPREPAQTIGQIDFEAMWDERLVLLTTRESLGALARKFDVAWFIPQIVRYRRLIGEVLLITLALNLLGLAAPLFFQKIVETPDDNQGRRSIAPRALPRPPASGAGG